jgi:hypothetical protein
MEAVMASISAELQEVLDLAPELIARQAPG